MQEDMQTFTEKLIPNNQDKNQHQQRDMEKETPKTANTQTPSQVNIPVQEEAKKPMILSQWQKFADSAQTTLKKWQTDWEEANQKNWEKIKNSNTQMKAQWEANNQKFQQFMESQQSNFTNKLQEMQTEIKDNWTEQQSFGQQNTQQLKDSWNTFLEGQRKTQKKLMTIQNRLWWKGYLNFLVGMLGIVVIIIVVIQVLKYFDIIAQTGI